MKYKFLKTLTPADVYAGIWEIPIGYRPKDFRPPKDGETYLALKSGRSDSTEECYRSDWPEDCPRIILEKIPDTPKRYSYTFRPATENEVWSLAWDKYLLEPSVGFILARNATPYSTHHYFVREVTELL